ncbi:hypothetical protein Pmar_PMAR029299 [Perkinsus marinus ATCC 50983]|uniref:Uncharacterized protein n=1 Tax=Perkinsus marinus (strain ATCC 50983 / TXsc) TaxID=423536 RepID=C5KMS5_PERM5|nr:hypothetical protein Pmar_PMAR029299 [Perkinsus marinus ATCC 50983]EER14233.1 hypothetical protein Pmar_PMAR029299 [Perkinsus marinus ATCC 50983]|eukprot:XP_002782438.1 hypothetical protein Pmar_PMAR029299 [Perkinsus marinus ATCC 50983]
MAPQAVDEETAAAAAKTRVASELGHDRIRYRHKKGNRRAIILTPSHLKSTPHLAETSRQGYTTVKEGCERQHHHHQQQQQRGVLKAVYRRKMFAHHIDEPRSMWEARKAIEAALWDPQPFRLPSLHTLKTLLPVELSTIDQGYPISTLGYYKSIKRESDERVEAASKNPDILRAVREVDESVARLQEELRMETAPGVAQTPDRALTRDREITDHAISK